MTSSDILDLAPALEQLAPVDCYLGWSLTPRLALFRHSDRDV